MTVALSHALTTTFVDAVLEIVFGTALLVLAISSSQFYWHRMGRAVWQGD